MAPAGFSGRRRQFDVACGVLSRCVKKAEAATAGKTMAAAPAAAAAPTTTPPTTMLLMPGADVTPDVREEEPEPEATQLAQLTIMYGDRVVVFDDFPSYRVAELLVLVAEREQPDLPGAGGTTTDIPVARKASLQRFMEKRRDRLVARAPYAARPASSESNKERRNLQAGEQDARGPPGSALVFQEEAARADASSASPPRTGLDYAFVSASTTSYWRVVYI